MRHLLASFAAWLAAGLLLAPGSALAEPPHFQHVGTVVLAGCLLDANDGCTGAPAGGQVLLTNFVASSRQSGQVYAGGDHTYPWQNCAIDYPCGHLTPLASMGDPVAPGNHPAGCTPITVGTPPLDYVDMDCNNPAAFNWQALRFDRAFGHGAVFPDFHNSTANNQTFHDVYMGLDDNCVTPATSTFLNVQNFTSANFTLTDFTIAGNPLCHAAVMNGITLLTTGVKTVEYFYMSDIPGRPINTKGNSNSADQVKWGAINGWGYEPYEGHGEVDTFASYGGVDAYQSLHVSYVATTLPSSACNCSTTHWFLSDGSNGETINSMELDHTVNISNRVAGLANLTGSITYTLGLDAGTGLHNLLTCLSGCGDLGVGSFVQTTGATPLGANVFTHVAGSGVGSTWTMVCQEPAFDGGGAPTCATAVNTDAQGRHFPDPPSGYASQVAAVSNGTMSGGCVEIDRDNFVHLSVHDNYCDFTGSQFGFKMSLHATCSNPATFANNFDLVTGLLIPDFSPKDAGTGCTP